MTKGLTKRIVSFITTLTMAAALLPGTVFAENHGSEDAFNSFSGGGYDRYIAEETGETAFETIDAVPAAAPDNESANVSDNRFENLTSADIVKVFSQTAEGIRSLYAGITEEEWETIKSILSEDEMNTVNGLLAGAGCTDAPQTDDTAQNDTAQIAAEDGAGIELMSIGESAIPEANKAKLKEYLAAHAGTYVTEKNYVSGDNIYEGDKWSVVIDENGEDVKLLYDNMDTKAVVSTFGAIDAAGKPTSFTFELMGDDGKPTWTTGQTNENKATLVLTWNAAGYIQFPNNTNFWWDKDDTGAKTQYKFSNAVYMYNKTKAQKYFTNYDDTYTINDGSGWTIEAGASGIKLNNGEKKDAIVRYVSFGTTAETYGNVTSVTFESPTWYNSAGSTPYTAIAFAWESTIGVNATQRPEGFVRNVFKPNGTIYDTDKSILKAFVNGSTLFTPNKGDFSTEYFKGYKGAQGYAGTYSISGAADLAAHYDPIFANMKLKVEDGKVQVTYDGTTWYTAAFATGRTEQLGLHVGESGETEWAPSVANMLVYMPGYYTNVACTTPAYLTLTWQISNANKNDSEGKGAWRFYVNPANLYKPTDDGNSTFLRMPAVYFDSDENYIQKAKDFLKNYAGTYYYNYDNAPNEYMEITQNGDVEWYYYNGTTIEKREPAYYTFGSDNTNGQSLNNNSQFNYINGASTFDNPWKVASVTFTDNSWFDNATSKSDTVNVNRSTVTIGFDYTHERFTLPNNNKSIYTAMNGDANGNLIRTFNAYGQGSGGGDRERYIRYDKAKEYLTGAPTEYTMNDGFGWKITIDDKGQPTLSNGDVMTTGNIKVTDVTYVNTTNTDKIYPYQKKGLSSFSFRSPDWYNQAGTQNYQTLSPAWSHYVSTSTASLEHPEGFERFVFNTGGTLWSGSTATDEEGNPTVHDQRLKVFVNNYSYFTADGGYVNEYFKNYQGEYPLGPGFGKNYNSMYTNWKIVIDDLGNVKLETDQGEFKPVMYSANRIQKYDAGGQKVDNEFVPSVNQMVVPLVGYYSDAACTSPAFLTLNWVVSNAAAAKDHSGDPYKYFTANAATLYQPDADDDGQPEMFKAPTLYFMHTDYVKWYKDYYKQFPGKYYVNRPGAAEEYIEIQSDGTPVYHDFNGNDHEAIYVTRSNDSLYVLGDSSVYPSAVQFTQDDWYTNNDNGEKKSAGAAYGFTWANDQTANFTNARRFTAPNAAVYAAQEPAEEGAWADKTQTELKHYFTGNVTYTYEGAGYSAEETADNDKASIAEMKEYLKQFAYIDGGKSPEYTEYSFNNPSVDWGIRITKDGEVLVDFDDDENEFVKVNPRPVFADSKKPEVGLNGRYLSSLFIEVPNHYSNTDATQPAFVTLTWANGSNANITTHYFTVNDNATLYHSPETEADHKVVLSSADRFVCDAEADENDQYMAQYAGDYYANDGSDLGMRITEDGKVQIKFGIEEYKDVTVAPTFTENATYGKYVSSIAVPFEGYYADKNCEKEAVITFTANLRQTGANQDYINNYFTATPIQLWMKDQDGDGENDPFTFPAIDFSSEADYENAKEWLSQNKYTGEYHPQMTDSWYAEVEEDGSVYFYVDDPTVTEDSHKGYRKIKPHITLKAEINDTTHVAGGVSGFSVMFPNSRAYQANNNFQAVQQIQKVSFGAATINGQNPVLGDESAYIYANSITLYDAKKTDGSDWVVTTSSDTENYNKTFTKLYNVDRAYSDANKQRAREYFKQFAGTYYMDDPFIRHYINISEEGDITWIPEENVSADNNIYNADVAFNSDNATLQENEDGTKSHLPKSIYMWYNGFRTGAKDQDAVVNQYTPFQRGDVIWYEYNNNPTNAQTYHSFYGGATLYKDTTGTDSEPAITLNGNYHYLKSDAKIDPIVPDGDYETADLQYTISVKTTDGKTTYTFKTPDDGEYPLSALGTAASGYYLRGKIGENFVFGQFTESYGALISSSAAQIRYLNKAGEYVTIPINTAFTNFGAPEDGNIVVANPGETIDTGETYARFAKAMANVKDGGTIYLKDNVTIGYMAEIAGNKTITIDGQGHTISRATAGGVTYTGSLFKIDEGDNVTFKDVKIDAGAYWDWNNTLVDRDIQISTFGVQLPDGRGGNTNNCYAYGGGKPVKYGERKAESRMLPNETDMQKLIDDHFGGGKRYEYDPDNPEPASVSPAALEPGTGTNVVTTGNLIQVGGTVNLENTEIGYMSTYDAETDKYGGYGVFGIANAGAVINLNEGTDIHHLDTTANALVRGMNNTTVNFNDNAQVHEVYASSGNGGLIDMRSNSTVTLNDNAELYDVFAYNSNGSIIMDYGGKLEITGGSIHHNAGVGGTSNGHGMTLYIYNNSEFTMTGGEIAYNIGHGTSTIYQQPGSKSMNLQGGKLHDNLRWTQMSVSSGERTDTECDIYVLSDAVFGGDVEIEEDIVINEGGNAENHGTLSQSVTVLGKQEGEETTTFKNYGDITGDLYVQNGADVTNEKDGYINGKVTVEPPTTGDYGSDAGSGYFVNNGEVHGELYVSKDAKVFNSGYVDADVTVESGGEVVLDGGGYIEGNVTLYPGGELRTNNNSQQAQVKGKITVEYKDEEDRQRFEDIFRDSNISATEGIEYVQHEHKGDTVTLEATCYREGYSYIDCACGEQGDYQVISMKPHNLQPAPELSAAATCTEPAKTGLKCINPGCTYEVITEEGSALGHTPILDEENSVAPTTISEGVVAMKCERDCGWTETATIPTLSIGQDEHDMEQNEGLSYPAGCDHTGMYVLECKDCGQTVAVPIPTTPHTFGQPEKIDGSDKEPKCDTPGSYQTHRVCTVCGAEEEGSVETIEIPAPGHQWINSEVNDGWVVDEASRKYCTDETTQTRTCQVCGESETEVARAKAHDWQPTGEGNVEECTVCHMVQGGLNVDYSVNGGAATQELMDAMKMTYTPGTSGIELWQPTNEADDEAAGIKSGKWTKNTALGQAVFVGWSTVDCGAEPFYEAPADANFVTTVDIAATSAADAAVYAVWALDRNSNLIADYTEGKVKLSYNANGGTGTPPAVMEGLLVGASYPITTQTGLTKTVEGGTDAVFAGWSITPSSLIIPSSGANIETAQDAQGNPVSKVTWEDGTKSVELITSPYTIPQPTSGDYVYLYAVYAESDGSGNTGFDQDYRHVSYYAPGATGNRYDVDATTGLFYTCNDHHLPGDMADLMTTQAASVMIYKTGAVLIGWTQDENWNTAGHPLITSVTEETGTLVTQVEIPQTEDAKVYAVWAVDANSNGIRDYAEETLTHTYYLNDRFSNHASGGSDIPTLPYEDENGDPITEDTIRIENSDKLPNRQDNILVGQYLPFPGTNADSNGENIKFEDSNVIAKGTLYRKDGETVYHHYVQIGWSGYPHGVSESTQDENNWVIGKMLVPDTRNPDNRGGQVDNNGYLTADGYYYRAIKDARFISAYVVWAIDDNENGIADYNETPYKVTFDGNGCDETSVIPEPIEEAMPSTNIDVPTTGVTREGAVLVGWSFTKLDEPAASRTQLPEDISIDGKLRVPTRADGDDGTELTAYAVWAVDENGNGKPDYADTTYTVTYAQAENGQVAADKTEGIFEGDTVTLTVTPDSGYKLAAISVAKLDNETVQITPTEDGKYTFTMPASDVTVTATFVSEDQDTDEIQSVGFITKDENGNDILNALASEIKGEGETWGTEGITDCIANTLYAAFKADNETGETYTVKFIKSDKSCEETVEGVTKGGLAYVSFDDQAKDAFGDNPQGEYTVELYKDGALISTSTNTIKVYKLTYKAGEGVTGDDAVVYTDAEGLDAAKTAQPEGFELASGMNRWNSNKVDMSSDGYTIAATLSGYYKSIGGGGSGSGGGSSRYTVGTPSKPDNGSVSASPKTAGRGEKVTLTVTPDEGYTTGSVTVKDSKGNAVDVTDNQDGTYTFVMPGLNVSVETEFVADGTATPAPETTPSPEPTPAPDAEDNCPSEKFVDIDQSQWYHEGIDYTLTEGLMSGTGDITFEPDSTTTRAMIVSVLYRLDGSPEVDQAGFTDVPEDAWYADAVAWGEANGVVSGYDEETFGPDDYITREQMAAILYRYAQYKGIDVSAQADLSGYSDADAVSDWAAVSLSWANAAEIVSGISDTELAPTETATRAQVASILMRFCENIVK